MSAVPYKSVDRAYGWAPEVAYADKDNDGNLDEANAAGDTFWPLPVHITVDNPILIRPRKKFVEYNSISVYVKHIGTEGYEDIILTISGPVWDHSWDYYLKDAMTTTDDSPAAGYYTHVRTNSATRINPPKSFEIWTKEVNDKAGGSETLYWLFVGCIIIDYKEVADEKNNVVNGTYTVHVRRLIAGAALNTEPVNPNQEHYNFLSIGSNFTWTKGGVAVVGKIRRYEYVFQTDKRLARSSNYYPIYAKAPNKITEYLMIDWEPWETDSYDDSQDDPHSALNKDVTLKIAVDATYHYYQIAFADCFQQLMDNPTYSDGNLVERHKFMLNPHEAASSITSTEVNAINDDRYET